MKNLTAAELMDLGDAFATHMSNFANEHGVGSHDLLLASSISHRLLQLVRTDSPMELVLLEQEAAATFRASSTLMAGVH